MFFQNHSSVSHWVEFIFIFAYIAYLFTCSYLAREYWIHGFSSQTRARNDVGVESVSMRKYPRVAVRKLPFLLAFEQELLSV